MSLETGVEQPQAKESLDAARDSFWKSLGFARRPATKKEFLEADANIPNDIKASLLADAHEDPSGRVAFDETRMPLYKAFVSRALEAQNEDDERRRLEASLTPEDKKMIDYHAESIVKDPLKYRPVREALLRMTGNNLNQAAGAFRTLADLTGYGERPADFLRLIGYKAQAAVDKADREHPMTGAEKAAAFASNIGAGLMDTAAKVGLVGPHAAFAGGAYLESRGSGQSPRHAAMQGAKGLATAETFRLTEGLPALERGATVGAGTYGLERAAGTPHEEALESAATNALFSVAPEAVAGGRRAATFLSDPRGSIQTDIETRLRSGEVADGRDVPRAPETPETVAAQLDALKAGRRRAVVVTPGESMPEVPQGYVTTRTAKGVFIHDPKTVSAREVTQRVSAGTHGELLGHVTPGDVVTSTVVVARDPSTGRELQTSYATPETAEAQAAELRRQFPGAEVEVGGPELADRVVADRHAARAADAPADPRVLSMDDAEFGVRIAELEQRPPKGTAAAKRESDARELDALKTEVARRFARTAPRSPEPLPLPSDVPTFREFVEEMQPRGGVRFESLSEADPLYSELKAEYDRRYNIPPPFDPSSAEIEFRGQSGRRYTRRPSGEIVAGELPPPPNVVRVEAPTPAEEFHHGRFGRVVASENQTGVGAGRVRVTDEGGAEHLIQRPNGRGDGNRLAVRAKSAESPAAPLEDAPASIEHLFGAPAAREVARVKSDSVPETTAARPVDAARVAPSISDEVITGPEARSKYLHGGDMPKASDALTSDVARALSEGRKVTLKVDGRDVPITSVERGMLSDAQGNRWGLLPLFTGKDESNALRMSAPTEAAKPSAGGADPIAHLFGAAPNASPEGYGARNRLVTEERARAARERLRLKLSPNRLSAGLDPTVLADLAELGAYHLEATGRDFAAWSKAMVDEAGERIKPHLEEIYARAQRLASLTPEDVEQVDADDYVKISRLGLSAGEKHNLARLVRESVAEGIITPKSTLTFEDVKREAALIDPALIAQLKPASGETLNPVVRYAAARNLDAINAESFRLRREIEGERTSRTPEETEDMELRAALLERDAKMLIDVLYPTRTQDGRNLAFHRIQAENSLSVDYWVSRARRAAERGGTNLQSEEWSKAEGKLRDTIAEAKEAEEAASKVASQIEVAQGRLASGDSNARLAETVKRLSRELEALKRKASLKKGEVARQVARADKNTAWANVSAARKAGLLASVRSVVDDIVSTTIFQPAEELSAIPGSLLDMFMAKFSGQRTLSAPALHSPLVTLGGTLYGYGKGIKDAPQILRHGATEQQLAALEIPHEIATRSTIFNFLVNGVFRVRESADNINYSAALARETVSRARTVAINEARAGEIPRSKIKDRTWDLMNQHADLFVAEAALSPNVGKEFKGSLLDRKAIETGAREATFHGSNPLTEGMRRFRSAFGPLGNFILDLPLPFDRSLTNMVLRSAEYTGLGAPIAAARALKRVVTRSFTPEEQRSIARQFGRGSGGSMLFTLAFVLAGKGLLTGPPSNKSGDRELDRADGRQPYSIKVGDSWVSYKPLGVLFVPLASGALTYERMYKDFDGAGLLKGAYKIGTSLPLLRAQDSTLGALENPKQAKQTAGRIAGSFIPTPLADIATATDTSERDARGFLDPIKMRVPGLREQVPASIDVFGRPTEFKASDAANPFMNTGDRSEKATNEMRRLGVTLNMSDGKIEVDGRDVILTREERDAYQKKMGGAVLEAARAIVSNPRYDSLPESRKKLMLKQRVDAAREKATNELHVEQRKKFRGERRRRLEGQGASEHLPQR